MPIISVFNLKGGVGKTTTCVNLASLAATNGHSTLLVDLDPQGGASFQLGMSADGTIDVDTYLSSAKKLRKFVQSSAIPHLSVLPAGLQLRELALSLDDEKHRRKHFRDIIRELAEEYVWVFIDSPPSITLEVENVLRAADCLLIPVIPTTMGVHAYQMAAEFLDSAGIEPERRLVLFCQVEKRKSLHLETIEQFRESGSRCLNTIIPFRSSIERSAETGTPIALTQSTADGPSAYRALWQELSAALKSI